MTRLLKLTSADSGVGRVRLYPDNIEAYFEFDTEKSQSKLEKLFEALESNIVKWGDEACAILKKSKTEKAARLLEEYDEIFDEFTEEIHSQQDDLKKYRIIKMYTGTFYTVQETIEEIDDMIEDHEYKEKYGI